MNLGLALPQFHPHASPQAITRVAQEAELMGLDSLWVQERLLRPTHAKQPYGGVMDPWPEAYRVVYDPVLTLTWAAAATNRVLLGTSVIDALFHSPVILGRELATLDQLSGGRLVVSLGQGWSDDEFEAVNVSPRRRGGGFEEFVQALRKVWGPDPVGFQGRFYNIPESQVGPKPLQQPHPALLTGAFAPAAINRAGRLGLGFNPVLVTWEMFEGSINAFQEAARGAGHPVGTIPIVVRANVMIGSEPGGADRQPMTGVIDQVLDDVRRIAGMEVDHVFFDFYLTPQVDPDQQLSYLRQIREAVS